MNEYLCVSDFYLYHPTLCSLVIVILGCVMLWSIVIEY